MSTLKKNHVWLFRKIFSKTLTQSMQTCIKNAKIKHPIHKNYHLNEAIFLKIPPPNITCTIEEVWSFQDVTILEKRFSIISIHERLCLIHLPVLHHLQPLRVMPTELLTLDLLAPLHIIFLQTQTEILLAQDTERLCLCCLAACAIPKMWDESGVLCCPADG